MERFLALGRWARRNLVVLLLGCVLVVNAISIGVMYDTMTIGGVQTNAYGFWENKGPMPRLTDIREPSIDATAAWTEVITTPTETLPLRLWMFLLIAYVALLVFNLAFPFERTVRIQWRFEALLTALVLLAWYQWDTAEAYPWFPLAILQTGILVYAIYLYFFDRRMLRRALEEERIFVEDQNSTPL